VPGTGAPPVPSQPDRPAIAAALASAAPQVRVADSVDLVFVPCPKLGDGRHANNQWLLELPHPITRQGWDNAALVSPKTAHDLHLSADGRNGAMADVIRIERDGKSVEAAVWAVPGVADDTVVLTLGWGRTEAGRYAKGSDPGIRTDFERLDFGGFDF